MMVPNIRKELFWDVDVDLLDENKQKRLIIERVLNLGNLQEFKTILDAYGAETIKKEIKSIGYFDPKTLSFIINYFHLDKKDLKCCTKKQLHPKHWI